MMCLTSCIVLRIMLHAQESVPKLIDAKWLKENLSRENMRIVDVRDDVKEYWKGHIPGAVYLDPEAMKWPQGGVPVKLIRPAAFVELLGEMGIDRNTFVIAYSERGDFSAPYLVWALDYIGHEKSAVLDGGFLKWEKEKGAVTQDYPQIGSERYPPPSGLNENVRATLKEVEQSIGQEDVLVLDVRTEALYTGEAGVWKRRGHIQGAVHHFWGDDMNEDGTWKEAKEIRRIYETLGATPDKTIIVSCGQGSMSSHTYFTLKHVLGYPKVKHYDGSFHEWSNLEELPVQSGRSAGPDPEKLLQNRCTACHNLDRVHKQKEDAAGWEKIIDRMIKRGTKLNETERMMLVDFLSKKGK